MNYISDVLFWISTGMLVPVIILLIFFFLRALLLSLIHISEPTRPY